MRILVVGSGGVGDAVARIAARRRLLRAAGRGRRRPRPGAADRRGRARARRGGRPVRRGARSTRPSADAVEALVREHGATHVLNAVDPRFVLPIFEGVRAAGARLPRHGDVAVARAPGASRTSCPASSSATSSSRRPRGWEDAGQLALVGIGVEPGLSDVFARYAADHLFSAIDELGVRDGANLVVRGDDGEPIFAPSFSIWTTIEECLNPPVIWSADRAEAGAGLEDGWYTVAAVPRARGLPIPGPDRRRRVRARRARGGAPHAALGRRPEGDVQVRAGRGVHRRAADPAPRSAWTGREPVTRRGGVAGQPARRRRGLPARPGDDRAADDRLHVRGAAGDGHGQGRHARARCTCTTWSTTPGRWPSTARSASCGRPR